MKVELIAGVHKTQKGVKVSKGQVVEISEEEYKLHEARFRVVPEKTKTPEKTEPPKKEYTKTKIDRLSLENARKLAVEIGAVESAEKANHFDNKAIKSEIIKKLETEDKI